MCSVKCGATSVPEKFPEKLAICQGESCSVAQNQEADDKTRKQPNYQYAVFR